MALCHGRTIALLHYKLHYCSVAFLQCCIVALLHYLSAVCPTISLSLIIALPRAMPCFADADTYTDGIWCLLS